ncbi:putative glycoside hydrolase [Cytobacillus sp. Hz8]|uniref:putative glycoside hydrolase n=1 Tax=Cytobacillus sp. Hz8 TaxID=3347168 RepID=UPI0035E0E215
MHKIFLLLILLFSFFPTENILAVTNHIPNYEPIKGIYVNAPNTKKPQFNHYLSLVKKTELNAMVIDIKDDDGHLTFTPSKNSPYYQASHPYIKNPKALMNSLESNHIYPIARIVVFKDRILAKAHPNWAFRTSHGVWKNARGDSFTNPFLKEVWDYNIGMAIEAAKLGFKEIHFDYVRFPEQFEKFEHTLTYKELSFNRNIARNRVTAITEFVRYARQRLQPYHVNFSVATFGIVTVIPEAHGIGQNFSEIAANVDAISAMIYPSHWTGLKGIRKPDLEPFRTVQAYAKVEKYRLGKLRHQPITRPWIQDFTATWLGKGNYKIYGKKEVEDQIRALHSQGVDEFLLWSSTNKYTPNVDYTPY